MAYSSGERAHDKVNQWVQGKEITNPNLFNAQSSYNSTTRRFNVVDKQSGSYIRTSVKESNCSGDVFKERSTGRVGFKDELKKTSTFKVGDKRGFSEYQVEERFRNVNYDDSGSSARKISKGCHENIPIECNEENEYDGGGDDYKCYNGEANEIDDDGDGDDAWRDDYGAFHDDDFHYDDDDYY